MPRDHEADRLTQEWRSSVGERLRIYEERLEDIKEALTQLMLNASTHQALGEVEKRVRELEKFQIRAITIVATTQIIIAIAWQILINLLKK